MRSIRLSLVIYFLVLLSGALGAVSWLVYQTAAKTLHEKEERTQDLVMTRCSADCQKEKEAFDRQIFDGAEHLARLTMAPNPHLYPLGFFAFSPFDGHLSLAAWASPGLALWHSETSNVQLGPLLDSEDTVERGRESHEYLQIDRTMNHHHYQFTYRQGRREEQVAVAQLPMKQRSRSLENLNYEFTVSEEMGKYLETHPTRSKTQDIDLPSGVKVRCMTMKVYPNPNQPVKAEPRRWGRGKTEGGFFGPGGFGKGTPPKGTGGKGPPAPPKGPGPFGPIRPRHQHWYDFAPSVYIHFAVDSAPLHARLRDLETERDQKLTALAQETKDDLANLRMRLAWISLVAFVSILTGSFLLIWLGLAPLSRLSYAVSRVSPRDFRLRIDPKELPVELVPIADGLAATLEQLRKAFAREKQAAADISHELRTPLAALLTTAEVALKKQRTPEEYRELLQDCQLSGQTMMHLVERLLALARLDAGAECLRPVPVDVAHLARQCADMVRPLADARGLSLQVHAGPPLPLEADANKLREVLTNLLHNAIQYNKPDGKIDLTVQRENGHLLMEVRDTGIGITPEAREHIFERFFRADPSRHSDSPHAGLGLAIVKSYIDLMGGHIDVDSSNGEGSTFRVRVPAVHAPASPNGITANAPR